MHNITSRFIETPCRKAVRYAFNYTTEGKLPDVAAEDVAGAHVRIDATVWQDESEKYDFPAMKEGLLRWGAESVDIRIIRVPRETVRAESVLKAETLRQKIEEAARIKGEEVPAGVLDLADLLQGSKAEELLKSVMSAGGAA